MSAHSPKCEAFYHSRTWKRCREAFAASRNHTCEMCGKPGWLVHHKRPLNDANVDDPGVSLDWSNLMLLCPSCHDRIHHGLRKEAKGEGTEGRYVVEFDDDGNVVVKDGKGRP